MKFNKLHLCFFLPFLLASCSNADNRQKVDKREEKCTVSDKPKIFLDFWGQMTESDYNCVSAFLTKSRKLIYDQNEKAYYYALTPDTLKAEPEFKQGRLSKISLIFRTDQNFEAYAIKNQRLTIPSQQVRERAVYIIERFLKRKYGSTPVFTSTQGKLNISATLGHEESLTWHDGTRLIMLRKELSPVYVTPIALNLKGIKIKVIRYVVTRMQIDYLDKALDDAGKVNANAIYNYKKKVSKQQYQNL
jgi:hypothetical protein